MNRTLALFVGVGVLVVAAALVIILYGNKGSHLELKGEIMKIRTGAIDENSSAAVLDFRVQDIADVPFVVREVKITAEQPNGDKAEGILISKADFKQLLDFNKFLGRQFNDGLAIRDRIEPHQTIDRMVAARFEIPQSKLDSARQVHLWIQDMDGPEFETVKKMGSTP